MKTRRGIFAVVLDENNNALVLHRVLNWKGWEVIKGGIDGNSERKALQEELWEEAGLRGRDIVSATRTNCFLSYSYPKWYKKKNKASGAKFRGWLVRIKKKKASLLHNPYREHDKFKWVPLAKAILLLTYANHRSAVRRMAKQFKL